MVKVEKIIQTQYQQDVDFSVSVNLLFDENGIFVTYLNSRTLFYEIWVTEIYRSQIENLFTDMLYKHFFENDLRKSHEDEYYHLQQEYMIIPQKYIFPLGISQIQCVHTLKGVTKRNLLIITPNNQVYSLDRALLSTRRIEGKPLENTENSFGSIELPPYHSILPITPMNVITYNHKLVGLEEIIISPTMFESTSLVLIYGHDLYFTRVSPEKGFDMLNEDFNYFYLMATVVTILAATFIMRRFTKRSKIFKAFLST